MVAASQDNNKLSSTHPYYNNGREGMEKRDYPLFSGRVAFPLLPSVYGTDASLPFGPSFLSAPFSLNSLSSKTPSYKFKDAGLSRLSRAGSKDALVQFGEKI